MPLISEECNITVICFRHLDKSIRLRRWKWLGRRTFYDASQRISWLYVNFNRWWKCSGGCWWKRWKWNSIVFSRVLLFQQSDLGRWTRSTKGTNHLPTFLVIDLCQDINKVSLFIAWPNLTFPWRKCSIKTLALQPKWEDIQNTNLFIWANIPKP